MTTDLMRCLVLCFALAHLQAATAPIIACCGDSITSGAGVSANSPTAPTPSPVANGVGGPTNPGGAYPNRLSLLLSANGISADVRNFGISGATVNSYLDATSGHSAYLNAAVASNPQYVVIMLGTNDTVTTGDAGSAALYRSRLLTIITRFANLPSPPTIWLCRPPKIYVSGGNGLTPVNARLDTYVLPQLASLAADASVPIDRTLINVHDALLDDPSGATLFADQLHPNDTGAQLLAQTVFNAIRSSISPSGQSAPSIASSPATTATVGQAYSYQVSASGNPTPTLSLSTSPTGMTITNGLISWTPSSAGSANVTVTASNGVGSNATQSFAITISAAQSAPSITSTAPTTASLGLVYSYQVTTSGTPAPTLSLTTKPANMGISNGLITWTAVTSGNIPVTVTASNGVSPNATQSFTISVTRKLGDVNGDGTVNATDLNLVSGQFGRRSSDAGWNVNADSNGDGRIDASDLSLLLRNLGN